MKMIARLCLSIMILVIICAHGGCSKDMEQGSSWTGTLKDGTVINVEDLNRILANHKKWIDFNAEKIKRSDLKFDILQGADLGGVNLPKADLRCTNLQGARLSAANLQEADLSGADLQRANVNFANLKKTLWYGACLKKADLSYANLQEADLRYADLQKATLDGANLQEAIITDADLNDCDLNGVDNRPFNYYEPKAGSMPYIPSIARATWLQDLTHNKRVHGLVDLREGFKRLGYREQERKITYAILHSQAWQLIGNNKESPARSSILSWDSIKGYIFLLLFEYTCKWGMSPFRPLLWLLGLILPFSFFYMMSLKLPNRKDGIWKIWVPERARKDLPFKDRDHRPTWRKKDSEADPPELLRRKRIYQILGYGLYFSVLSAFHIGWRDVNVGNWIARIQLREYTLRPSGWVRVVSGIQSLISVYLLALFVLTYFGRPFESFAIGPRPPMPLSLQQIEEFGSDPGNLKMFAYIPREVRDNAPLVVALHGCSQNAHIYADRTEWNELADRFNFYVVYPEQQSENNKNLCFNWFSEEDIKRDVGEALSIWEMVKYMLSNYAIDRKKVYITGLSAGGYMATVLLATYPEDFAGGAIMAGGPYGCANNIHEAVNVCMPGKMDERPKYWGDLVRKASNNFTGFFPILSIFHGDADSIVHDSNMRELVKQWTNVHQADHNPDEYKEHDSYDHRIYYDNSGKTIVETYHLKAMGHAISVDPGNGMDQGGTTGISSEDKDLYSSFYAAKFWGIVPSDILQ